MRFSYPSQLRDSAGFKPDFALALWETPAVCCEGSLTIPPYTANVETKKLSAILACLAALVVIALARKRPVKPPAHDGNWEPRR